MSEVQRYKTVYTSDLYESDQGDLISAHDYDAAQSELSALREENERLKSESFEELYNAAIDERDALLGEVATAKHDIASFLETTEKVCALLGIDTEDAKHAESKPSDVLFSHATAMQQRLTAAEQRNAEMTEVLHLLRICSSLSVGLKRTIDIALKPTESGARE